MLKKFTSGGKFMSYVLSTTVAMPFDEAVSAITAALKEVGFGILTEIDMTTTLKNKIDVDIRPYRILGACNPSFAYEALKLEDSIGALLPCNVVVSDEGNGTTQVRIIDPVAMVQPTGNDNLVPFAQEVRGMLQKALGQLNV